MPYNRSQLHLSKVDEFAAWCEARGWKREPTKGLYEVLRMRKPGRKPLILYRRDRGDHATIGWDRKAGASLVGQWLREKRQSEARAKVVIDGPEEAAAAERDAVLETFGEDGLFYEEATGKQLGDK